MLLKPRSLKSGITYKDYLQQNYFCIIERQGLKKINLKGINIIGKSLNDCFIELTEDKLFNRKFEDHKFSETLIKEDEKPQAAELFKQRLEFKEDQDLSFVSLGAVFSIEMADILLLRSIFSDELKNSLDAVKDSMIFSGKDNAFGNFMACADKYRKYLDKPSDLELLNDCKKCIDSSLQEYEANQYAHIILGLIRHRPGPFFDLLESAKSFMRAKELSTEGGDGYAAALANFFSGWLAYINSETDKALVYMLEANDEEFMNIPEIYYNLAKFYAVNGDGDNSIKYLDEAVERFDNFYAMKADMDDDFNPIREKLGSYFKKIVGKEKEKVSLRLAEYGVVLKAEKTEEKNTEAKG
jgi:hypothetical protein